MAKNISAEYQKWYRKKNYRTLNLTVRHSELSRLKALSEMYADANGTEPNLIRYIIQLAERDAVNYNAKELKKRTAIHEAEYEKEVENIPDWIPKDNPDRKYKNRNLMWPHCDINADAVKAVLQIGSRVRIHKFAETRYIKNWQNGRTGTIIALNKKTATVRWDKTDEKIPYFEPETHIPYNTIEIIYDFRVGDRVSIITTPDSNFKENDGIIGVISKIEDSIVTVVKGNKEYKAENFCIEKNNPTDILKNFTK